MNKSLVKKLHRWSQVMLSKTDLAFRIFDYKDIDEIPEWAMQAVKNLSAYEIVQGNAQNEFKPNRILTKAEAIELTFKLVKQLEADSMTDIK